MIPYERLKLSHKPEYDRYLLRCGQRGCEYAFANLFLWGRRKGAVINGNLTLFSQFNRRCVYAFPVGEGDLKATLDAIIHDARTRGIPCCLSSLSEEDKDLLETLYPGAFRFYTDRDNYDYVYSIDDLADLKGRKFQKKRNHVNRFDAEHPDCRFVPLDEHSRDAALELLQNWFDRRAEVDPDGDYHLEQLALDRAFAFFGQLGMEALVLMEGDQAIAFTMGSRLSEDTFDIHFEKAREDIDGAYAAINRGFARYLREKYPEVRFLNREEDMGIPGLRKAKLSYNPHHLVEKYWARLWEDEDEN